MLSKARVFREIARQGLLPFPAFFVSVKPFGTPLAPISLKLLMTAGIIVAAPAADAVNLLLDLSFYPGLVCSIVLHLAESLLDPTVLILSSGLQCSARCRCLDLT